MSDVPMPPDILSQILSWLPVSSLLKLRLVSKTFRTLIDSSYVIKLHINHSLDTNTNNNLIFGGDRSLHFLNLDSCSSSTTNNVVKKIDNPLYFALYDTVILGSCNGVVCLCTTEPDNEVAFWNPLVRKFRKMRMVPAKNIDGMGRGICIKGFGYDHVNDDFKVVRLVQYVSLFNELEYSKIEVFGARSDGVRREVGEFPYYLCYRRYFNVFANGALHWLVSEKPARKGEFLIAAFNVSKDELRLVPNPDIVKENVKVDLAILGGCVCMVCNYPKKNVDIWVMKSYGVQESWSKLISTSDVKLIEELDFLRPIVYDKSGKEVLLEKNFQRLYWYNLESKMAKRFKVAGMPRLFVTELFTGSLVQVTVGNASKNGKKKEKVENKKERKKDDFLSKGFRLVL